MESRPLARSAWLNPASVNSAAGCPGAVAVSVRPVYPAAPCPSAQARLNVLGVTPQMVAESPTWKLTIVSQMLAVAARSSTKNVSVPLPLVRKLEPVSPFVTSLPWCCQRVRDFQSHRPRYQLRHQPGQGIGGERLVQHREWPRIL